MKLTLLIFVLFSLNAFVSSTSNPKMGNPRLNLLRKCQKQTRRTHCGSETCFKSKIEGCFKRNLGDDWKENFLPEAMKGKYNLDYVVKCQANSLFQCSDRICARKKLQKCLIETLGNDFIIDFVKGQTHKNEEGEKDEGNVEETVYKKVQETTTKIDEKTENVEDENLTEVHENLTGNPGNLTENPEN